MIQDVIKDRSLHRRYEEMHTKDVGESVMNDVIEIVIKGAAQLSIAMILLNLQWHDVT